MVSLGLILSRLIKVLHIYVTGFYRLVGAISCTYHYQVHPTATPTVHCQLQEVRFQLLEQGWLGNSLPRCHPWPVSRGYIPASGLLPITEGGAEGREREAHTASLSSGKCSFPRGCQVGPPQPDTLGRKHKT